MTLKSAKEIFAKAMKIAHTRQLTGTEKKLLTRAQAVIRSHTRTTSANPKRVYSHEAGKRLCECADSGCPVHKGKSYCSKPRTTTVYRTDMDDKTGTDMCAACAQDAMQSGYFTNPKRKPIKGTSPARFRKSIEISGGKYFIYDHAFNEVKAGPFDTLQDAKAAFALIKSRERYTTSPRHHAELGFKTSYKGGQKKHNPAGAARKIYGRCLRIEAVKTTAHTYGGKPTAAGQRYFHDFTTKNAKIYGLPNGDLLISTR